MKKGHRDFYIAAGLLAAFAVWTVLVCIVDVKPIGPNGSTVGFAALNGAVHKITGVHLALYNITDWLSVVPIFTVLWFALLGLVQWVKRKKISQVDPDILILGGHFAVMAAVYALFEVFVVNYRPILIQGVMEASYPSSTTLLVMCVMPVAIMQLNARIKHPVLRKWVVCVLWAFTVFMVAGRLVSGVHWFTDIVGGALFSTGLVLLYRYLTAKIQKQ